MQIFGKFTTTIQIARRLSCNYSARRYTSLVQTHRNSNKEQSQNSRTTEQQGAHGGITRYQRLFLSNTNEIQRKQYHVIRKINNETTLFICDVTTILGETPIKLMFMPMQNLRYSLDGLINTNNIYIAKKKSTTDITSQSSNKIFNFVNDNENIRNEKSCIAGFIKIHRNPIILNCNMNRKISTPNLMFSKFYSNKNSTTSCADKPTSSHVVCVAENGKGCVSPGNAQYPPYDPNNYRSEQVENTSMEPSCIDSNRPTLSVQQTEKGNISSVKTEYPIINAANQESEDLFTEHSMVQTKKCNPDHDYSSYENIFQDENLLKCDALGEAIKLKKVLETQQQTAEKPVETATVKIQPQPAKPCTPKQNEKNSDIVVASCGDTSKAVQCPMYPHSSAQSVKDTCKKVEHQCHSVRKNGSEEMEDTATSNQVNKPEIKANSCLTNQNAMFRKNAFPQTSLFDSTPLNSITQFKPRGMHASKKGGKNKDCKDDPCKEEEEESCPDKCADEFAKVKYNEDLIDKQKKKKKLVGCPPKAEKAKETGVCANVVPKKTKRSDDSGKKNYHTIYYHGRQVPKLNPKSEILSKREHHTLVESMPKNNFKISWRPQPTFLSRLFTKTSCVLKSGKGSPCESTKKDKKKIFDMCKKKTEGKTHDATCKKKAADKTKKDELKKKEDPCKKKDGATNDKEKKNEALCARIEKAKKREDPCKKKDAKEAKMKEEKNEALCARIKKANKTEDPCKKNDEAKKKEDPCKKNAERTKEEDACKEKEGAKNKEDPCKKNDEKQKKKGAFKSMKEICGNKKKETKPSCKKYSTSTLALSDYPNTSLKAFHRGFNTFNIRNQFAISKPSFRQQLCNSQLTNYERIIKRNEMYSSIFNKNTPVKALNKQLTPTYKINKSFISSSVGQCRHYSSKKDDKNGSNCSVGKIVMPKNRKPDPTARPRDRLATDCFKESGGDACGGGKKKLCSDPSKTSCKNYAKTDTKTDENKNNTKGRK